MQFIKKHWILLVSILFVGLYLGFWSIAVDTIDTIEIEELREDEDDEEEEVEDVVPADIVLDIEAPNYSRTYDLRDIDDLRMFNEDSLWDLLESLREEGLLTYETLEYTHGPKVTSLNGVESGSGMIWNFYDEGEKIHEEFDRHRLEDEHTYILRLEPQ